MAIYQLGDRLPVIDPSAFVYESATIIGHVRLGREVNVWPNATLRGDNEWIDIADFSNVQESVVMHTDPGCPLVIERNVTIGHQAMLHGCTVKEGSLIGIQAVVLNRAVIGRGCLIGAGALVTEGKEIPDFSLVVGSPAKVVRPLTAEERERLLDSARLYAARGQQYRSELKRIG